MKYSLKQVLDAIDTIKDDVGEGLGHLSVEDLKAKVLDALLSDPQESQE